MYKLKLFIKDEELKRMYNHRVNDHNNMIMNNLYADSGFDLLFVEDIMMDSASVNRYKCELIDMGVKCEMLNEKGENVGFYIYPRSSMSKTPLVLGNHVGIIDAGYRGYIKVALRNLLQDERFELKKHTRLTQICSSDLRPFYIEIVNEEDLTVSKRGEGGFGSTGK